MNNENLTPKKCHITDTDRDNVRRLAECGMTSREIADILHIGKSSVSYIRAAYNACVTNDFDKLREMCAYVKPTVEWALRVTNTDPSCLSASPKACEPAEEPKRPEVLPVIEHITRNDFLAMCETMQDIRNLLVDIRDVLK